MTEATAIKEATKKASVETPESDPFDFGVPVTSPKKKKTVSKAKPSKIRPTKTEPRPDPKPTEAVAKKIAKPKAEKKSAKAEKKSAKAEKKSAKAEKIAKPRKIRVNVRGGEKMPSDKKTSYVPTGPRRSTEGVFSDTAAGLIQMRLVEGKKSDDAIWSEIQEKYGLADWKRGYIAWCRSYLKRRGVALASTAKKAAKVVEKKDVSKPTVRAAKK